ncbi:MAG: ABC transporter permease [Microbacterium sp.]|jgi:putative ABC transport system permease protein|uniref:ABC transporter permease n=1 Tax=Microbacterium ginsengisoli TaxID=400772 RepID=A0A0F0LQR9_9MICO|nr:MULTISPECIES: ABC transporter permease [Microbacterium]MAL07554.1 ABC transporter permease [Microbacterium sp.]MCK9915039.1 ABC transporter permease [Microbacteriaceae bacterium K1510]KJL34881.1 MacB-like periplasmic core domain protein [Microbacterium ginsengisoli]KJL35034.1 MacB-like periplasmic core domain protein [Microbacterium ginsengisoli]KQR90617.1 hypothetical protein ASG00_06120 [Microbacterium sp. Leaf351]
MYLRYLRRELGGRKKQTAIVAAGLAIAIALVVIVNSLAAGVKDAQSQALASVYGVGTDLTVTGAVSQPGSSTDSSNGRFQFGSGDGSTSDGTTTLSQSRLVTDMRRGTLDATALSTVTSTTGVAAASGALSLTNMTFSGQIPSQSSSSGSTGTQGQPPSGGESGGAGGPSSFDVNSFTVLGIDPSNATVGPLSAVTVSSGRLLTASDKGTDVAVVDSTYATSKSLAVGSTISVGGTDMTIVGIVASSTSDSSSADTASDVYIPLDVAQKLAGVGDVVSTIYVQATSADAISSIKTDLSAAISGATVSSQSDLASTVSGSLSSATSLITNLGTWLSVIVLVVALALAVLFTISGVSRRTREFGTLKAIGWSNGRVVGQVAGETLVQGLIGGVVGLVIGLAGIIIINIVSPTISSAPSTSTGGQGGPGGGGGAPGGFGQTTQAVSNIVLHAPVTVWVIVAAIGLAVLGGVVAGAFGGWRAARLSPAEALRSVA